MKTTGFELTMLLRSGRVFWTALAFAAIVLCSSAFTAYRNHALDEHKLTISAAERDRWLGQSEKDAHDAAHHSVYAFKLSRPLHALDPGIQPYLGQTVWLEPHTRNDMIFRPLQEAEPFQRMGQANAAKFITQFGPLLVFLVAFAATAADREKGAMRIALGAARRPGVYVWGKWAATFIFSAVTLLVPALIVGGGATLLNITGDDLLRLVGWTAALSAYLAVLAAIAVAVCLNSPSARLGFVVLLGVWVSFAFVAPPVASTTAERITQLPSYEVMRLQIDREAPNHWTSELEAEQMKVILRKYGVSDPKDLPVDLRGVLIDYNERHGQEVFEKYQGGYYRRVIEQDRTFSAQSWMSPAVAAYALSSSVAGSDFAHHYHFMDTAEKYRRALVNQMNHVLMTQSPAIGTGKYVMNAFTVGREIFDDIPDFSYQSPSFDFVLRSSVGALVGLLGWMVVGYLLIGFTARRVRP